MKTDNDVNVPRSLRKSIIIMAVGFCLIVGPVLFPLPDWSALHLLDWNVNMAFMLPGMLLLILGSLFVGYLAGAYKTNKDAEDDNDPSHHPTI